MSLLWAYLQFIPFACLPSGALRWVCVQWGGRAAHPLTSPLLQHQLASQTRRVEEEEQRTFTPGPSPGGGSFSSPGDTGQCLELSLSQGGMEVPRYDI